MAFMLEAGQGVAVTGPSGTGKTTLLHLVLGLLHPSEGRILLEGQPWAPLPERDRRLRRPRIQAVFQEAQMSLPPHRTGWEILQDPLEVWRRGTVPERREAAARMADLVGFPEAALDQFPEAWSGGLAQRLALGRALMLDPALLVLDEPFSALDPALSSHLLAVLLALKAQGMALLLATHQAWAAEALCETRVALGAVSLPGGPGSPIR